MFFALKRFNQENFIISIDKPQVVSDEADKPYWSAHHQSPHCWSF